MQDNFTGRSSTGFEPEALSVDPCQANSLGSQGFLHGIKGATSERCVQIPPPPPASLSIEKSGNKIRLYSSPCLFSPRSLHPAPGPAFWKKQIPKPSWNLVITLGTFSSPASDLVVRQQRCSFHVISLAGYALLPDECQMSDLLMLSKSAFVY